MPTSTGAPHALQDAPCEGWGADDCVMASPPHTDPGNGARGRAPSSICIVDGIDEPPDDNTETEFRMKFGEFGTAHGGEAGEHPDAGGVAVRSCGHVESAVAASEAPPVRPCIVGRAGCGGGGVVAPVCCPYLSTLLLFNHRGHLHDWFGWYRCQRYRCGRKIRNRCFLARMPVPLRRQI